MDRTLANVLENTSYEIFQEVVKLIHGKSNSFLYPDIMVTCDGEDIASAYTIKKPVLVLEVLSSSTEGKDRGKKLAVYCAIPTLHYYLLINQNIPYVEVYSREKSLAVFQYRMFQEMSDVVEFAELGFQLSLEQIYRNVRFENNDS
ncbi:MAG: Uma2 family endonuclease [Sphingobacteriaceae bacterium]|nr:MAG: Uma2 family endonuclease [Sphingobacteriaceae bacterium]